MTKASRRGDSQASLGYRLNHRPVLATKKDPVLEQNTRAARVWETDGHATLRYLRINTKRLLKKQVEWWFLTV